MIDHPIEKGLEFRETPDGNLRRVP
jgi:hypothetical protein